MRHLLIVLFAFVLIASPFMAHHANGAATHEDGGVAHHEQQAVDLDLCESGCDDGLQITCCSQAITHCSPTFSYNGLWTDVAPVFASLAYFVDNQNLLISLMFEAETPPPRV